MAHLSRMYSELAVGRSETPVGVEPTFDENRFAGGCRAVWLQRRVVFSVLAKNRTWSSTFAGSRANPAHSEDKSSSVQLPCRGIEPRLAVSKTAVLVRHTRKAFSSFANKPRADDWIRTSIDRFTKPVPFSVEPRRHHYPTSTSARSRTPSASFGGWLLSREHARVKPGVLLLQDPRARYQSTLKRDVPVRLAHELRPAFDPRLVPGI